MFPPRSKSRSRDEKDSWCRECHRECSRIRHANNREKSRANSRKWYSANKEKAKESAYKWREVNKEKYCEIHKLCLKKILGTPRGKLNNCMRRSIWYSLHGNKNGDHWESLVGYTVDDLKKHLEKQFNNGMTWENYGLWHIDHKIPISVFNFENSDNLDFKKCWSLKNLKPLWAKENMSKYNKLNQPFQPSLRI